MLDRVIEHDPPPLEANRPPAESAVLMVILAVVLILALLALGIGWDASAGAKLLSRA